MSRKTGKKRFRVHKQWFRSPFLVLQEELEGDSQSAFCTTTDKIEYHTWWEDVAPESMMEIFSLKAEPNKEVDLYE